MAVSTTDRLRGLLSRFGVNDPDFIDQALTNQRTMARKIPRLLECEQARDHLCLDVTLLQFKTVIVDREALIAHSGVDKKKYENRFRLCRTYLSISDTTLLIDALSAQIGGNITRVSAYRLLEAYDKGYVQKLPANAREAVKIGSPVYHAAAFFLTVSRQKVPGVHKDHLIQKGGVSRAMFEDICKQMKEFESYVVVNATSAAIQATGVNSGQPIASTAAPPPSSASTSAGGGGLSATATRGPIRGLAQPGGKHIGHSYSYAGVSRTNKNENVKNYASNGTDVSNSRPAASAFGVTASVPSAANTSTARAILAPAAITTSADDMGGAGVGHGRKGLISRALTSATVGAAVHLDPAVARDLQLAATERSLEREREREAYHMFKANVLKKHYASIAAAGGDCDLSDDDCLELVGPDSTSDPASRPSSVTPPADADEFCSTITESVMSLSPHRAFAHSSGQKRKLGVV